MQTIHLLGDSVSRGYALRAFEPPPTHPLYVFRSIWSSGNALMEENGIAIRFAYGDNALGDSTAPVRLAGRVVSGIIGLKDIVVIEDAGDVTSMDPDAYQAEWEAIIAALVPAKVCIMTMFDYPPAAIDCQFDMPFRGSSGVTRTFNDAIRAAAIARCATVIDMNAAMDAFQASMAGQTTTRDIDNFGIHPGVFSQTLMLGEILRALGITPFVRSTQSLTTPAHTNWQALQYNAPSNYWGDSWPAVFINKAIFG